MNQLDLDTDGCLVLPGFVDFQCNGAGGIDLTAEPERLWEVAALLPRWGVTAWQPTIVTSAADIRDRALLALAAGPPTAAPIAAPIGLHFEGPFLAPEYRGAHDAHHLAAPSLDAIEGWTREAGVAMVTLAPELPGALDVIHALVARGVTVSAGHSGATLEQARAGFDAGVAFVTHLFNAMRPLHHREPGLVGAALTDARVRVGLIADGVHVDPVAVDLARRALGERLVLVTDAVAPLGVSPGDVSRLPDGTLAGSTVGMDRAVRNLMAFTGCSLADAARAAAPVGRTGDLVVLTPEGDLVATVIGGEVAWRS